MMQKVHRPHISSAFPNIFSRSPSHSAASRGLEDKYAAACAASFLKRMFARASRPCRGESTPQPVNPGARRDGGARRAPTLPSAKPAVVYPRNVHFIGNLGEPSHCARCAQRRGEAQRPAGRVPASARQSPSQGSVGSHQAGETPRQYVARLPSWVCLR